MSEMITRLKRATKEILGLPQWPRVDRRSALPKCFEDQVYASLVREGDICFDIGAHIGNVSLFLSRLSGPEGIVIAFEPVWPVYTELCRNLQRASDLKAPVITIPTGFAETEMTSTIQVPGRQFGLGSLAPATSWSEAQPGSPITSFECRFSTIDIFTRSSKTVYPNFIKVDVEGAELFVLRGAREYFAAGHRPLMLVELFAPWQRAFGYHPREVLRLLMDLGYCFLFACPEGLIEHQPTQDAPFPAEYERGYNVIAFHPTQHSDRIGNLDRLRRGGSGPIMDMPAPPIPNVIL